MSECLISRRGGAGIPPSVAYPIVVILTESTTWTVPRSGTYRVTCIGSGGLSELKGSASSNYHYAGGGGGGIGVSQIYLSKSEQVAITVSDAVSGFGNYVSATAGESGTCVLQYDASVHGYWAYTGGTGGNASGDSNYPGGQGKADGFVSEDAFSEIEIGGFTNSNAPFGGAHGCVLVFCGAVYWSAGDPAPMDIICIPSYVHTPQEFYSFGGGQGYCFQIKQQSDTDSPIRARPNGAVIIEQIQ